MRIEKLNENTKKNLLDDLLKRSPNNYGKFEASVQEILNAVKEKGDEAVFDYTEKFDGVRLDAEHLLVTEEEIADLAKMFRAISIEELKLFPGVPEMLQRLKDAGKKVFLLSNAQALFTAPEISLLGLTKYFDGILLSSDAGVKKPDPAFYEMLLKQYHLDPAECLMTGNDDIADCHGAASAGIASCYVATRQSPKINGPLPENGEKIAAIAELF